MHMGIWFVRVVWVLSIPMTLAMTILLLAIVFPKVRRLPFIVMSRPPTTRLQAAVMFWTFLPLAVFPVVFFIRDYNLILSNRPRPLAPATIDHPINHLGAYVTFAVVAVWIAPLFLLLLFGGPLPEDRDDPQGDPRR
jgi:hypothetical protein